MSEPVGPNSAGRGDGAPAPNDNGIGNAPAPAAAPRTTILPSPAFPEDEFVAGDPRQRSPMRSFLFISAMLFFLNSGTAPAEDFWTARARYQGTLAAMRDRAGNYSLWVDHMNTSHPTIPPENVTTNSSLFWLAERPPILGQLLQTLNLEEAYQPAHPGHHPDGVYYSNLTALFRGPIGFWNVTPPVSPVVQSASLPAAALLEGRSDSTQDLPSWYHLARTFLADVERHPLMKELPPPPPPKPSVNLTALSLFGIFPSTRTAEASSTALPESSAVSNNSTETSGDAEDAANPWPWHNTRRITLSVDDYPIPGYPVVESDAFLEGWTVDASAAETVAEGEEESEHVRDRRALGGVALLSGSIDLRTKPDPLPITNATNDTVSDFEEQSTSLPFLGLHLTRSGAVYGLASSSPSSSTSPDLRLIPALAPTHIRGAVARLVKEELARRVRTFEKEGWEAITEGSYSEDHPPGEGAEGSGFDDWAGGYHRGAVGEGMSEEAQDGNGTTTRLYDPNTGEPRCSFAVFGQVENVGVPRSQLAELEAALVHPTGADTIPPPPLRLKGVMISPGCGVMGVFGERGEREWGIDLPSGTEGKVKEDAPAYTGTLEGILAAIVSRRINLYAALAFLAYLSHLILLQRHVRRLREIGVSALSAHSAFSILPQLAADAVSFVGHVTVALISHGRSGIALLGAAVVCASLAVLEGRLTGLIWEIQRPEREAAAAMAAARRREAEARRTAATQQTQIRVTTSSVTVSDTGSPLGAAGGSPAAQGTPPGTTPPAPALALPARESFLSFFWRHVRNDPAARIWLVTFGMLVLTARILVSPQVTAVFAFCTHGFIWLPEIYRAFRRGRPSALGGLSVVRTTAAGDGDVASGPSLGRPAEYIMGTTVLRSVHLLYFLANEGNVFEIGERAWARPLVLFMFLQAVFVILQSWVGPTFFMPARLATRNDVYDYHPPLPTDLEAALGDCAICMEAIDIGGEGGSGEKETSMAPLRGARKEYSLAPCHHLFHTKCLERWLAIKNICPQCRRPLPPL